MRAVRRLLALVVLLGCVAMPASALAYTPVDIEGADRYETAVAASRDAFADGAVPTAVVASGENWPDALGASSLAGVLGSPVLLVKHDALPSVVATELARLGTSTVILVGGTAAVTDGVRNAIGALPGMQVRRIGGTDRYDTARLVAERTRTELGLAWDGRVFLATGEDYPDALAAGPLAARGGWPVLLTGTSTLPTATQEALVALGATKILVLGGTSAVSDEVRVIAEGIVGSSASRLYGENRYATAVRVATYGAASADLDWDGMALATGRGFADGLAGGPSQAAQGAVVLLTRGDVLSTETSQAIFAHKAQIDVVRFLGGRAAISEAVRTQVADLLQ